MHDFDFLRGCWRVHNRKLRTRLEGSTSWDEFEATDRVRPLLGGAGNEGVYRTEFGGGMTGMSLRLFDRERGLWSIYWADSRRGTLESPVVGRFGEAGIGIGVFEGDDTFGGRPIRVRFTWSRTATASPRWEQAFSADGGRTWETNWIMDFEREDGFGSGPGRDALPVTEIARYVVPRAERDAFALVFDNYFPQTFEHLGAVFFGQGPERDAPDRFTYLRGFPSMDARAEIKGDFYDGRLWRENAAKINDRLTAYDDVLLLRPLSPGRGLPVAPPVDLTEPAATPAGAIVLQIFPGRAGQVEEIARDAERAFTSYRLAGLSEAGVLATLEAENNFPRHPVRADGPYLVWVGLAPDEDAVRALGPLAAEAARALAPRLRARAELVVIDPTRRSRLRGASASVRPRLTPAAAR